MRILEQHPTVTFIGVAPQQIDYGVARMFEQHVDAARGGSNEDRRTYMVRSMEDAEELTARLGAT